MLTSETLIDTYIVTLDE